jgi:hypothetical protein
MENLGIFYEHMVYFAAIGNILWPFGIFCGDLVYFLPFWYHVPRKIWQHWPGGDVSRHFPGIERLISQNLFFARFSSIRVFTRPRVIFTSA